MKNNRWILIFLLVMALSACTSQPKQEIPFDQIPSPAAGSSNSSETLPVGTLSPTENIAQPVTPAAGKVPVLDPVQVLQTQPTLSPSDQQALIDKTRNFQAQSISSDVGATAVALADAEVIPAVWTDSGLGCPGTGPDMPVTESTTPGYIIILHIGESNQEYHVGPGQQIIQCENPAPPAVGMYTPAEQARQDLASRLKIISNEIMVINIFPRVWPDSSLGCSNPDVIYTPIEVQGYTIILGHAGRRYEYHTGPDRNPIYCEPTVSTSPIERRMIALAKRDLVKQLSIALTDVSLVSIETITWPDSGLGCGVTDSLNSQVQTSGYRIILRAQGIQYEYHTDQAGNMRSCYNGKSAPPASGMNELEVLAKQDLAQRMSIPLSGIILVSLEAVTWPDSSLGCGIVGTEILPVMTPGYRIILSNAGVHYEYHASQNHTVMFCDPENSLPASP